MPFSDRKIKRINICAVRIWDNSGNYAQISPMHAITLQTTLLTHYGALHSQET